MSPRARRRRGAPVAALVRVALFLAALALLWRAEQRLEAWRVATGAELRFKTGKWFEWVLPAALAGAAFGLALRWPRRPGRYRWGRALGLGLPSALLLLHYWVALALLGPREVPLLGFLERPTPLWEPGPQFALAAFVGVAVASGFSDEAG
ncbi:MAG TPA: hypothetical protein VNO79_04610 [Actinomycetota bacterium]|nr:hypothetical protein [Actinomycetota bacterium]